MKFPGYVLAIVHLAAFVSALPQSTPTSGVSGDAQSRSSAAVPQMTSALPNSSTATLSVQTSSPQPSPASTMMTSMSASSIPALSETPGPQTQASDSIQTTVSPVSNSESQNPGTVAPATTSQPQSQSMLPPNTMISQSVVATTSQLEPSPTVLPSQVLSSTVPVQSFSPGAPVMAAPTMLPQCTAEHVKDFKITSPMNFRECLTLNGNVQYSDSDKTTLWLQPQQGNPISPGGDISANPIPVPFTSESNVSTIQLKPSFMTISWKLPMENNAVAQPGSTAPPDESGQRSNAWGQEKQQQMSQLQNQRQMKVSPLFSQLLAMYPQAETLLRQQEQQQQLHTCPTQSQPERPSIPLPRKIFNPVSVKLVNSQGGVTNGSLQVGWYQSQQQNRGALVTYLQESIPDGLYSFLITGQFQQLKPIAGLQYTLFSTQFYEPGPECAFITHPFRVISSELASSSQSPQQSATPTVIGSNPQGQPPASATPVQSQPATVTPAPQTEQPSLATPDATQNSADAGSTQSPQASATSEPESQSQTQQVASPTVTPS